MTSATWPAVFDPDFGYIPAYGGGAGDETPEQKAAREKMEAETAKRVADATAAADARAAAAETARKAAEDKAAAYEKAEADRKKAAMDDLTRAQAEAKEAREAQAKAEATAKTATLEAAKAKALAKLAADGKILEAEFIPAITDEAGMEAALAKAYERQQEVIKRHSDPKRTPPNLPHGGQGGKGDPVAAGLWEDFTKARTAYLGGDHSPATEKRMVDLRRKLIAAGINPETGKAKTAV